MTNYSIVKKFTKGLLEGKMLEEDMRFINDKYALEWFRGVINKTDLDYKVPWIRNKETGNIIAPEEC